MRCPKCGCEEIGSAGWHATVRLRSSNPIVPTDLNPKQGYCELLAECVQDECNGAIKVLVSGSTQITEETRWRNQA